jgi:hypothetical protein
MKLVYCRLPIHWAIGDPPIAAFRISQWSHPSTNAAIAKSAITQ